MLEDGGGDEADHARGAEAEGGDRGESAEGGESLDGAVSADARAADSGVVDGGSSAMEDGGGAIDAGPLSDADTLRDAGAVADSSIAVDASAGACVNVSGGGDEPWFDLTVVGTGFDADEGRRMRIVAATQSGNRVGIAELPIVGGGFALMMPAVLNRSWYVGVTLYVDRNDNDTCETDEHAWDWATRIVVGDMRFDVTPDELCDRSLMACRRRLDTRQACWVGTGDTVLTKPLHCSP